MTILRHSVFDPFVTSLEPVPCVCVCVCLARKASAAPASLEQGRHAHPRAIRPRSSRQPHNRAASVCFKYLYNLRV